MKCIKYVTSIGLNDQTTKRQEITDADALQIIAKAFQTEKQDATLTPGSYGIYTYTTGETVIEHTIRADIYDGDENKIERIINFLKIKLNQESIALETVVINSEFK